MANAVFDLFAKIGLDSTEFSKGMANVKKQLENGVSLTKSLLGKAGDGIKSGIKTIAKTGVEAIETATKALGKFATDAVKTGMSFDQSMANVAATLGKTVDEVQDLREFAKQMGETTRYSAIEAAEGLNYMALAGYDAEKSMEMLPKVMNLASAGAMDLANASDMVTDAESALQLTSDQTTVLIDQMAKTASSSNTSVEQLGEAILQIGGSAKDLKGGTLELTTLLGELANNGMKGAEGGTHLRNMLNSLIDPSDEVVALFDKMNVSLFDSKGNMNSLNDVFKQLDKSMSKMTTEARKKALTTIFNARDLKAAEALLAGASKGYDELQSKIADSKGAAVEMAQAQEDTLQGAKRLLDSAIEGLKINVSEMIIPTLTSLTKYGTNAISSISSAVKRMGESFKKDGFAGLLAAFTKEFSQIKAKALDLGFDVLTNITKSIAGNAKKIGEGAISFISTFAAKLADSNLLKYFGDVALNLIDGLAAGLSSQKAIDGFLTAAPKFLTGLTNGITTLLGGENGNSGLLGAVVSIIENTAKWMEDDKNKEEFKHAAGKFLSAFCKQAQVILDNGLIILADLARLFLDTFLDDIDYDHGAEKFWISFGAALKKAAGGLWDAFLGGLGIISPEQAMSEAYLHAGGGTKTMEQFREEWERKADALGGYEEAYEYYMNQKPSSNYDSATQTRINDYLRKRDNELLGILGNTIYGDQYLEYAKSHDLESTVDYGEKLALRIGKAGNDWYKMQGYADKYDVKGIPVFGDGGIVSKPTLAMVGERGEPEAVVPLGHETETSRALGLGGFTFNITINAPTGNAHDISEATIQAFDQSMREYQIRQQRGIGGSAWQR